MTTKTGAALVAIGILSSSSALASEPFPPAIHTFLKLDRDPECTLCHETIDGGEDTVTRPFGRTMIDFGAKELNVPSLYNAMTKAYNQRSDSDGDGVYDLLELKQGSDPNVPDREPSNPNQGGGGEGQGGDDGFGGGGELGLPPLDPSAFDDLPPPLQHGCSFTGTSDTDAVPILGLGLAMLLLLKRRREAA